MVLIGCSVGYGEIEEEVRLVLDAFEFVISSFDVKNIFINLMSGVVGLKVQSTDQK